MKEQLMHEEASSVLADSNHAIKLRSVILTGTLDESMSSNVCKQLLSFEAEDPQTPICMYINSFGGSA
jgi:ATP-dependent protease ClpP protease subunit